ncbi:hypothetical protein MPL1032_180241 [Mesorhizobium plurifarium]|uniref:Uncharacterized protein n=1 Tax=Mesorhizobium plurifarium TaxID=69974 RepID=A0A0K2VUR0_MESPL|nr:hypothetical protein MPL1032_180241 [Mesorhizobium plurifarium]
MAADVSKPVKDAFREGAEEPEGRLIVNPITKRGVLALTMMNGLCDKASGEACCPTTPRKRTAALLGPNCCT